MFNIKHFNELNIDELYEIVKARYEVFACEQKIFSENDFDDIDKNCYHIFLQNDNEVIAYSRIIPKEFSPYNDISIGRVLVLPKYRRHGFAKQMMLFGINFVKNNLKENTITLSAQEYIKDLYLECGFTPISDIYDEVGIPHLKMRLK